MAAFATKPERLENMKEHLSNVERKNKAVNLELYIHQNYPSKLRIKRNTSTQSNLKPFNPGQPAL